MYVFEGMSSLLLGGSSKACKVYELLDDAYELTSQTAVGEAVEEIIVDPSGHYLIVETSLSIQTFFKCPDECTSCHFPNNCSACVEGYELNLGKCGEFTAEARNSNVADRAQTNAPEMT